MTASSLVMPTADSLYTVLQSLTYALECADEFEDPEQHARATAALAIVTALYEAAE